MDNYTIEDAARAWLEDFDHVPASVIEKMALSDEMMRCYDSDSLRLVAGSRIECGWCNAEYEGELSLQRLRETFLHETFEDGHSEACLSCSVNFETGYGEPFPPHTGNHGNLWVYGAPTHAFPCAWSTLFAPRNPLDREWVLEHADDIADLGLFVFESEDYGCLLGIDGAGFDFYKAFWIPLYRLRGLQWHETD